MENINDLIYAYSLGCLDNEELQRLREHFDSGEELNIQELGEFQNLASLLPSILKIENPDPQLKDNVAKKLYRLKDEIKAQRQKNKPSLNIQESNGEQGQDFSLKEPEILSSENGAFKSTQAEENDVQKIVEVTNSLTSNTEVPLIHPAIPVKKNNNIKIWGFVLFFLLAIGIIAIYLKISLKTNNLVNEVEKLKKEVVSLKTQLIGSQEIKEMLQSPDVQVIKLMGTNFSPNSFGKLIIDSDKEVGYIQFGQMPAIQEDKFFQLWVNMSGGYFSLRTFQASDTMGFYSFKMLNLQKGNDINFLITEEPSSGSTAPSNKVYLQGKFYP
jgi:hypothetical protein